MVADRDDAHFAYTELRRLLIKLVSGLRLRPEVLRVR